jgi:hypothetical protein
MKNSDIKISDKCEAIHVVYEDASKESFKPTSKIEEYEDCYEFEESDVNTNFPSMVVIYKVEVRTIRFVKSGQ